MDSNIAPPGATALLAEFAAHHPASAMPAGARAAAQRLLLNALGCAVGGAGDPALARLSATLAPFAGKPSIPLLGRGDRSDPATAALLNGYAANILDFDDTHLETVIHPGPVLLPVVVSLAARPGVDGASLIEATLVGCEVACRLGNAVSPGHYARGWHITATCGIVGAAAATGRLLRLDALRMQHALGIAATQASGLTEMLGGMTKSLSIARAARDGLLAAMLAAGGFTASTRALEAPRGFGAVLGPAFDAQRLLTALGTRWETEADAFKPYPCGIVLHPLIDACLWIARERAIPIADIERIEVQVHPLVMTLCGRTAPASGLEAKLSHAHAAAVALARGEAGIAAFGDEASRDPALVALRTRVQARVDETMPADAARVRVCLPAGEVIEHFVPHATGSRNQPMTDAELDGKFRSLCEPVLGAARSQALLARMRSLASDATPAAVFELACTST
jgi:2-methylcitrate dehydratase PrpD